MKIEQFLKHLPDSYSQIDKELIMRAFNTGEKAHQNQKRVSGEPYFTHCIAVAKILAEMLVPPTIVAAGLLHDTVEDTELTSDDIRRDFGDDIGKLVDAVTKLTSLPRVSRGDKVMEDENGNDDQKLKNAGSHRQREAKISLASETLRKTFLAMADDPQVVIIKLADRLHNMSTLHHLPNHKQIRIAQETMDIFAPLASRLGIWQMKWELEDEAFRYLKPDIYNEILSKLNTRRSERNEQLTEIKKHLLAVLTRTGMKDIEITGRPKHIYSIYRKITRKGVPFELVHDVRGVRLIVPESGDCYAALGEIHANWRPIPGSFDDYIAAPKENFYRSLHTAVLYDDGKTLEIQIRTSEMHQNAEYGIAAHWRYKEGRSSDKDFERRIEYLRSLMEWRQDVDDAQEFVDSMKSDVFGDRVYVFTPNGDIIDLPTGATPIDFAYNVHTEVGHRCRGAKIGGKLVPLDTELQTGDQVEILTSKRGGPSRDWLNPHLGLIKSQRSRSKIRRWFKLQDRDQNIKNGRDLIDREMRQLGLSDVNLDQLAHTLNFRNLVELSEALGCGDLPLMRVTNALISTEEIDQDEIDLLTPVVSSKELSRDTTDGVKVRGLKGLLTRTARCCNPAPGDDIVGYITRGRGATVHRRDCPNVLNIKERERLVQVSWGAPENVFSVPIRVQAYDRDGLMRDISTIISEENAGIQSVRVDIDHENMAVFSLVLEVRNVGHLSKVLSRVEHLANVVDAHRMRSG
ncbi:MAG: bifunctional (p)ppGpp synthetase/guanosine-3',5'-bis(diphosphate) 3'-pyrophosphohydrolase [Anaerolineae bacterium]|nr:bifunctional (p)ppGpp synthetase/guanosine-3',5'-bis(diphosphate) 3'-pyrophosphohydrolase [Anaerolineae bacterium]